METIKSLTDEQLLARLRDHGDSAAAITSSTRAIFERKLLSYMVPQVPAPLAESEDIVYEKPKENGAAAPVLDVNSSIADHKPVTKFKEPSIFYGVQLPPNSIIEDDVVFVFIDKAEALKLMKKFPGSRFKPSSTRLDAVRFSRGLPDLVPASPKPHCLHPNPSGPPPGPSKPFPVDVSNYRSVKTQDLVKLRKLLEVGDVVAAKSLIWSNPRYLINSGDTPTILQEGFRYNALHVAAMKNQATSAQLIIDTLENSNFMQLLYVGEAEQSRENRIDFLVDLYLNTPDKGLGETALHFACKFGHSDVVKVLAAHPKTDRCRKNKYGDTPAESICARSKVPASLGLRKKIQEFLEDRYFVNLFRSEDNSCPPHVSDPWSPTVDADCTLLHSPAGRASPSAPSRNSGLVPGSPRDSPISVKAYAGPMTSTQAKRFRKHWMTPPSSSPNERKHIADIRRSDTDKGLERIGRSVAHDMDIPWSEYWEFLGAYVDFSTGEGQEKLEHFMKERYDSVHRESELDRELNMVSTRLNLLRLTSPPTSTTNIFGGKSIGNAFGGGDTLVLYMEPGSSHSDSTATPNQGDGESLDDQSKENNEPSLESLIDNLNQTSPTGFLNMDDSSKPGLSLNMNSEFWNNQDIPLIDDSDSDSDDSIDSFHTAMDPGDSDCESLYTPPQSLTPCPEPCEPETDAFFIYGAEPSKIDLDVLRALEGIHMTKEHFPYIYKWKDRVNRFRQEETVKWQTPRHIRIATQSRINAATPSRPILPAGGTTYSPVAGYFPLDASYNSPDFSPSSQSSASESDSSFDSIGSTRLNLMSSFLSDK